MNHCPKKTGTPDITYIASDWSMVQTVWTLCNAPIGVSATVLGTTSIQLDWTATVGAIGYIVEQSANGASDWVAIATPSANTFTKTGLTANTSYYYRVTAVNPSGYSATSQMINATTNDYIQLPTPTLNTPTTISTSGLLLSWNAITNVSSYVLQYRVVGDNDWITISSVTSPHHIAGLTAGTEYEFQLQAIGDDITYLASDWSMVQTAWTLCNAPIGVSATVLGTTSIQLDWSATTGATGYIVEQSANGSSGWITIATPSANTFTKTGLTPNTSYYYRVTAVNPSGYSATSQMINATTNDYIQLPTPTLNTPTTISTSGLLLSWNAITNVSSYVLQYRVVGDNDWITVSNVTSSHSITGLTAGTEYEFQLQAIGDGITYLASNWSMVQTVWTLCDTPIGVRVTVLGTMSIQLDWTATVGAIGYIVEQSANGASDWVAIASPLTNTFTVLGLSAGTTYYYRITAVNSSGTSVPSSIVNETTDDYIAVSLPDLLIVQEGCSIYLEAMTIFGEDLTYWWDLSGTGNGEFVQMTASFWISVDSLGFTPGDYMIRLIAKNKTGTESEPATVTLQVLEVLPNFNVTKNTLDNDKLLILNVDGYFPGGRVPQSWTIRWGDSSENYTNNAKTTFITAIHCYQQNESDTAYPITLTIVNSIGATETYFLGSHVVPGSSPSGAALPVILSEGELFALRKGTEFLGDDLFITTDFSDNATEKVAGYSAVSWFDPAFALVAQAGWGSFTRFSWNENYLLSTNHDRLVDVSLIDWFGDFATDENAVLEAINLQLPRTSESKNNFNPFDTEFDYFDTLFDDELLEYAKF